MTPVRGYPGRAEDGMVAIASTCPRCGRPEARRVARWRLELYRAADPGRPAETVDCRCGARYVVPVEAYQRAV